MNKQQQKEVTKIEQFLAAGLGLDYAARALSALHRCAMTNKSKAAIEAKAAELGVTGHKEFVV
jgi:uncharacterized protein YoaH (UPF0181 family)